MSRLAETAALAAKERPNALSFFPSPLWLIFLLLFVDPSLDATQNVHNILMWFPDADGWVWSMPLPDKSRIALPIRPWFPL
jgi:hypothetical protein